MTNAKELRALIARFHSAIIHDAYRHNVDFNKCAAEPCPQVRDRLKRGVAA